MASNRIVTVFGSAVPAAGDPLYELAFELGRALARDGWTVCNGGYGGTMEASAAGAVEGGGYTIGVTCSVFGRRGPNTFIRQEVPTFDLFARVNTLIRLGSAYVVLPGGTGTLLELAAVMELIHKSLLRPRRPVVLLGRHWESVLAAAVEVGKSPEFVQRVETVAEVCEYLRRHVDVPQSTEES